MIKVNSTWASTYFGSRARSETWINASETDQANALAMAGYIIDGAFTWTGLAYVVQPDGTIIWNDQIYAAICEQAVWMLDHNIYEYPEILTKGFVKAEGGPDISITLDKDFILPFLCRAAIGLIGDLGVLNDPQQTGGMIIRDVIRAI